MPSASKSLIDLFEVLEGCVGGTDSIHGRGFIHLRGSSKELRWEGGIKDHVYVPVCAGTFIFCESWRNARKRAK